MNESEGRGNRWHVDRGISLSSILMLGVQTVALVVWLASLNEKVNTLVTNQGKTELEVKTLAANVTTPVALNAARLETMNSRLFTLEDQLRQVNNDLQAVRTEQARRTPYIPKRAQ